MNTMGKRIPNDTEKRKENTRKMNIPAAETAVAACEHLSISSCARLWREGEREGGREASVC